MLICGRYIFFLHMKIHVENVNTNLPGCPNSTKGRIPYYQKPFNLGVDICYLDWDYTVFLYFIAPASGQ